MREYITSQVERRQRELAEIERRRLILEAELGAYADVLARLDEAPAPVAERAVGVPPSPAEPTELEPVELDGDAPPTKRVLEGPWGVAFVRMVKSYPREFTTDEILAIARGEGHATANRKNARSRMWYLAHKGLVERTAEGVYRVTSAGLALAGVQPNGASNGHSEAVAGTERPSADAGEAPSLWREFQGGRSTTD
jgi:hypothetical protein